MSSGPGEVVVVGRAQEAEAVGQDLEHALGEDQAVARSGSGGSRRSGPACAATAAPSTSSSCAIFRSCGIDMVVERPDVEHRLGGGRDGLLLILHVGREVAGVDVAGGVVGAGDLASGHGATPWRKVRAPRAGAARARGRFSPVSAETGRRGRSGAANAAERERSRRTRCEGFTASHFVAATKEGTEILLERGTWRGRSFAARGGVDEK